MHVLIVDDDEEDQTMFCESLKRIDPDVNFILVRSGEAAIKYLRHSDVIPEYIFLDIYMHGMDGKECLLKIKSIRDAARSRIIMYSGLNDKNQEVIYKKLGAHFFINKTASIDDLQRQIYHCFGNHDFSKQRF